MSAKPFTVLVVETHDDTLRLMRKLLSSYGHRILTAESCAAARRVAKQNRLDVLLCDVGLPDGNGVQLLRELKQVYPQLCSIAVTGYVYRASDRVAVTAAGFTACLSKPVDFKALESTMQEVCGPLASATNN